MNSPHKGQWRGALKFSLICARINGWVNNREAGDLRRHQAHCDVIVMTFYCVCNYFSVLWLKVNHVSKSMPVCWNQTKGHNWNVLYVRGSDNWIKWWRHKMLTFPMLLAICVGIRRWSGDSPHKVQWRGALMFSLICAWTNRWKNTRDAGDLRRHHPHHICHAWCYVCCEIKLYSFDFLLFHQ